MCLFCPCLSRTLGSSMRVRVESSGDCHCTSLVTLGISCRTFGCVQSEANLKGVYTGQPPKRELNSFQLETPIRPPLSAKNKRLLNIALNTRTPHSLISETHEKNVRDLIQSAIINLRAVTCQELFAMYFTSRYFNALPIVN